MVRYVVRRALLAGLVAFLASSLALLAVSLAPGDATTELVRPGVSDETVARARERLGLDRPLSAQYFAWVGRLVRFDLGESSRFGRPVSELLGERLAQTALLATASLTVATALGLWLGAMSGSRRRDLLTRAIGGLSMLAVSVPPLLASLLLALLAARTGWFPVGGIRSPDLDTAGVFVRALDVAWHLVLPMTAVALPLAAMLERVQSRAMRETLTEPFVRAAVARGVPWRRIVWCHAWPVAVRPVLGIYGVVLGSVFSGSFIVEIVSAWPGLGQLMYDGLVARDVALVAGCALAGSMCLAAGTLLSDLALFVADPRVRSET